MKRNHTINTFALYAVFMVFILNGQSMAHLGYVDGMPVQVVHAPCNIGSDIAFRYNGIDYLKTLTRTKPNGNIWVQGRDDIWLENGIKKQSLDSRVYGWLSPQQYIIYGCVL